MSNSVPVLEFHEVTKTYRSRRGAVDALNGMSFRLNAGAIHVLLGPNGAGKTTSLEMAVGLRRPDSGAFVPSDSTRSLVALSSSGACLSNPRK